MTMYSNDNKDFIPYPNWNPPWTGATGLPLPGWLYTPVSDAPPIPFSFRTAEIPLRHIQGGLFWNYIQNMPFIGVARSDQQR